MLQNQTIFRKTCWNDEAAVWFRVEIKTCAGINYKEFIYLSAMEKL